MCACHETQPLSYTDLLTDPMTRLVMESDGVSVHELAKVLEAARAAIALRPAPFAPYGKPVPVTV